MMHIVQLDLSTFDAERCHSHDIWLLERRLGNKPLMQAWAEHEQRMREISEREQAARWERVA
jgi:hypothetical protein